MRKFNCLLISVFLLSAVYCFADETKDRLGIKGEKILYSFRIYHSEKIISIVETARKTLEYRFGKPGAVELVYPAVYKKDETVFTLRWYMRPGLGGTNMGMTRLRFEFFNNGYKYRVYFDDYDEDNSQQSGIEIYNPQGKQVADLKGYDVIGSLLVLMDDHRVNTVLMPGGE
ncbi:MAG: hypothetical protein JW904_12975 [Spirochaetales bacterium]|nr:hypothetical protein [Spirochaetales bacterium]